MRVSLIDPEAQTFTLKDHPEYSLTVKNANIVHTGSGDDEVIGGGKYDGKLTQIFTGAGDDVVKQVVQGTVVHTGAGRDTVELGNVVLYADLDGGDAIYSMGQKLTGAVASGTSESPWALRGHLRMGLNEVGELIIENGHNGHQTFLSDAKVQHNVAAAERTAGLLIYKQDISATRLLDDDLPSGWLDGFFRASLGLYMKAMTGTSYYEGVDPLVLDLDGDGVELSARGAGSPRFDIDGDGFAEPTGWVLPGDGLLALDRDGNGTIDDVTELFGSPTSSGLAELALHDDTQDGVIDAADGVFANLRVWQDADRDGLTDAGELLSLDALGIQSISLAGGAPSVGTIAGNVIDAETTFTRTDGTTGTVADVRFRIDNFDTVYLGDTTVSPEAAALPNIRGRGTLTDLHVAMTQDAAVLAAVQATLPTLTEIDLSALRDAVTPILAAWGAPDTATRPSIPIRYTTDVGGERIVLDFGVPPKDGGGWRLASGTTLLDDQGLPIAQPTFDDVMAHFTAQGDAMVLDGVHIGFFERHLGERIPFEDYDGSDPAGATAAVGGLLGLIAERLDVIAVRLAVQGPLGDTFFQGIAYDVATDKFHPTTDRQLIPVYEAVFAAAPSGAGDAEAYLGRWSAILDVIIGDYDRGEDYLQNTYSFLFANIVAAFESTGLPLGIVTAAGALGIPQDLIVTGAGEMAGTGGNDIFYMNAGDQVARGGGGHDAYVFGRGFGQDVIDDVEPPLSSRQDDIIRFADILSTEVSARREGLDLILTVDATGDQVRVVRQFEGTEPSLFGGDLSDQTGIAEVIFADGVVWDRMDIAKQVSDPQPTDQTIIGTPTIDYLDGGAGNDHLHGGDNGDVYFFDRGYGNDTARDGQTNILVDLADFVMLGPNITPADVEFLRNGASSDLQIRIRDTGDTLTLQGQFAAAYTGPFGTQWLDRIEAIVFDNGVSYDWRYLMEKMVADAKTDGDDAIYGFSASDVLDGGAGNDFLSGGNESDTYIFSYGYGHDTIRDDLRNILAGNTDRVVFTGGITLDDIELFRDGGSKNIEFRLIGTDDVLTIQGQFDVFHTGPFGARSWTMIERFEFSDGTVLNWWDIALRLLEEAKTDGNDTIYGTWFADRLDGGLGNDYLAGGGDSDVYVFDRGYGQDTIHDFMESQFLDDVDRVEFGAGITPDDLDLSRNGDHLTITVGGTGDSLLIQNQFSFNVFYHRYYEIEEFHFADGTIWTPTDIRLRLLQGTAGDDELVGFSTNDTLDGGTGNDRLVGGDGADTYVFGVGYGQDVVVESPRYAWRYGSDKVLFNDDVAPSDVTFSLSGGSIVATLTSGDTLTIQTQTGRAWHWVDSYEFADGTILTRSQIFDMLGQGSGADDVLVGSSVSETFFGYEGDDVIRAGEGNDMLTGGPGNDRLEGSGHGDTYYYYVGDGHDVIHDTTWSPVSSLTKHDKLVFGDGILPSDVVAEQIENDLMLTLAAHDGSILIENQFSWVVWGLESIVFADGTVWDRYSDFYAAVATDEGQTIIGSEFNDTLFGEGGDDVLRSGDGYDTLIGGAGDDRLEGGGEGDTYIYAPGDGHDVISDYAWSPWHTVADGNRLIFEEGIVPDDVIPNISVDSKHLILLLPSLDGSIIIENEFTNGKWGVETIQFADGTTWTLQDLRQSDTVGTDGNDTIVGNQLGTKLTGHGGNDHINAGAGDDQIFGGDGDDHLIGGSGSDLIHGGDGIDIVDYSANSTDIAISLSDGTASGGDTIVDVENAIGGSGHDHLTGDNGANSLSGGAGDDVLKGLAGDDILAGGSGIDTFDGGEGSDTADFSAEGGHWIIDLGAGSATRQGAASETLISVENIVTAHGHDTISGSAVANRLEGGAGNDVLDGGGGNDTLLGGVGDDSYRFGLGGGHDTVVELTGEGTSDRVLFGAGIAAAEIGLAFLVGQTGVVFTLADGSTLTVSDQFGPDEAGIETFEFADGTVCDSLYVYDSLVNVAPQVVDGLPDVSADEDSVLTYAIPATAFGDVNDRDVLTYTARQASGEPLPDWLTFDGTTLSGLPLNGDVGDYVIEVVASDRFGETASTTFTLTVANTNDAPVAGDPLPRLESAVGAAFDFVVPSTAFIDVDVDDRITLTATLADGSALPAWLTFDGVRFSGTPDVNDVSVLSVTVTATDGSGATGETAFQLDVIPADGVPPVVGTPGGEILDGTVLGETLIGGAGDDELAGGGGDDTYWYNPGDGNDIIRRGDGGVLADNDVLRFGEGITQGDVTFSAQGVDLAVSVAGGATITVEDCFAHGRLAEFRFADGTALGWHDVFVAVSGLTDGPDTVGGNPAGQALIGLLGDDTIRTGDGHDVLIGGAGDDRLEGQVHGDTYVYNLGDGHDTIVERSWKTSGGQHLGDILLFGLGLGPEDLIVTRHSNDWADVTLGFAGVDGSIFIDEQLALGEWGLEEFHFADGTVLTSEDIVDIGLAQHATAGDDSIIGSRYGNIINGLGGNDILRGWDGADTLIGGVGDDRLEGHLHADTYVYNLGDGHDTIVEHSWKTSGGQHLGDVLVLGAGILPENVVLSRHDDDWDDVTLSFVGADGSIFIDEQFVGGEYGLEEIRFDDGTVWMQQDLIDLSLEQRTTEGDDDLYGTRYGDTIDGRGGNDLIRGWDGPDTLSGGAGDDRLEGGHGNDTFLIDPDGGNDIVYDLRGTDTVRFGGGVTADDLMLSQTGIHLVIGFAGHSSQIEVLNQFATANWWANDLIETYEFDDGSSLTRAKLNSLLFAGSAGDDHYFGSGSADIMHGGGGDDLVQGNGGHDTLSGGAGDDRLEGGHGNDRFIIDPDGGNDIVYDVGGTDTVRFGGGVTADDLILSQTGIHLVIGFAGHSGQVEVLNQFSSGYWWANDLIETYEFDDGSTLTRAEINALLFAGTDADDDYQGSGSGETLHGGIGNDTIRANHGHDTVHGDAGGDTLYGGNGNDIVYGGDNNDHLYGGEGNDSLYGGAGDDYIDGYWGVDFFDGGDGNDTVYLGSSNSSIDIDLAAGYAGVETVLNVENVIATSGSNVITAAASGSRIWARGGNDTVHGGVGNDEIHGENGNDTLYGGDGDDYIAGNSGSDFIDGGAGNDTVCYGDATSSFDIDLTAGYAGGETVLNVENAIGSSGNNTIMGVAGGSRLEGLGGNDTLRGKQGADHLDGGAGNDRLVGNGGADTLLGGAGDDVLIGGQAMSETGAITFSGPAFTSYHSGQDIVGGVEVLNVGSTLKLYGNTWKKVEVDYTVTADTMLSFEFRTDKIGEIHAIGIDTDNTFTNEPTPFNLFGTDANFGNKDYRTYAGDGQWQQFDIALGNYLSGDVFYLTFANDHDVGSPTAESWYRGIRLYEQPTGLSTSTPDGDDILDGGDGADTLIGGAGNDTLNGGLGDDVLSGDTGNDLFVFSDAGDDRIVDFVAGAGTEDRIDVSALGLTTLNDALAGAYEDAGDTVLNLDTDISVRLVGTQLADLHQDDFLFAA